MKKLNNKTLYQPQLCVKCISGVAERVEEFGRNDVYYCKHQKTLALFHYDDDVVLTRTIMEGPIEREEVEQRLISLRDTVQEIASNLTTKH